MNERQEIMGYTDSRGAAYLLLHLKKYHLLMKTFVSPNLNLFRKIRITVDFLGCIVKYGVGINDYFQYHFYKRKAIDRATFIVARNRRKMIKKCNGTVKHEEFDDKCKFNQIFQDYIARDWLDMDIASFDEFQAFAFKHQTFMSKMKNGSGGNGICLVTAEGELRKLYEEMKTRHVMVEEVLIQHPEMSRFNPASVNTLRVITLVSKDGVKVMNAVFRCGNGEGCTDNFHHFGLAALIDVKTGIVVTPAIDKLNQKYYIHPKSKAQIIGFKIPNWNQVLERAKSAAMVQKDVRFVGWDMVILENGEVSIIEGNCAADPDILQMPDQIGKWPLYKEAVSKI